MSSSIQIPVKTVGPIKINGDIVNDEVSLPLATFETPLWPSTQRGAKVTKAAGGITATVLQDVMTRSIAVETQTCLQAKQITQALEEYESSLHDVVSQTSSYAQLVDWHTEIIGRVIYIRFAFNTGDASGHNMATKASQALQDWLLQQYPKELQYVSISGNYCTDKKVSAVNGVLGRGKRVVTEMTIPRDVCEKRLKATPEAIVDLHVKKNLLGSIAAGSLRSANAHVANILLAFYLATGQDAANIVEGSQSIVHAEVTDNQDLYFSLTCPNLIMGVIGNGKDFTFVQEYLQLMGCQQEAVDPGANSRRLAVICASAAACCELSLLAALTNEGELMRAHLTIERQQRKGTTT